MLPLHESLVLVVAEGLPLCASVSYGSLCSVAGHVEMYIQGKGTYEERLQLVFELVVVSCALHSAPFFGLHNTYQHGCATVFVLLQGLATPVSFTRSLGPLLQGPDR